MIKKEYTFFDLDSTLYKGHNGYVIYDFSDYLHSRNMFSNTQLENMNLIRKQYSAGQMDRTSFALGTIKAYYKGIALSSYGDISEMAQKFWEDTIDIAWFHYSVELVELLGKYTTTVLISGSPLEILRYIHKYINFDQVYATEGTLNAGIYTGEFDLTKELATYEAKERLINSEFSDIDRDRSFAFGDSESDIPLLNKVNPANAFVIGKGKELRLWAKKQDWKLFRHEDNIIEAVTHIARERFNNLL